MNVKITRILFILAAAIYMQSGHGTAPYDAVSFLIRTDGRFSW